MKVFTTYFISSVSMFIEFFLSSSVFFIGHVSETEFEITLTFSNF